MRDSNVNEIENVNFGTFAKDVGKNCGFVFSCHSVTLDTQTVSF